MGGHFETETGGLFHRNTHIRRFGIGLSKTNTLRLHELDAHHSDGSDYIDLHFDNAKTTCGRARRLGSEPSIQRGESPIHPSPTIHAVWSVLCYGSSTLLITSAAVGATASCVSAYCQTLTHSDCHLMLPRSPNRNVSFRHAAVQRCAAGSCGNDELVEHVVFSVTKFQCESR